MSTTSTVTGVRLARVDPQPRLGGVEGHRHARPHGRPATSPAGGVDAARHVDAQHRRLRRAAARRSPRRPRRGALPGSRCRAARRRPAGAASSASGRGSRRRRAGGAVVLGPGDPVEVQRRGAGQALEVRARVAGELFGGADADHVTSRPASRSMRATTSPSPPLLPLPQRIVIGPSGAIRSAARVTAAPACSISSSPGTPRSEIAQRSMPRIVSASSSGSSQLGSSSTTADPRW